MKTIKTISAIGDRLATFEQDDSETKVAKPTGHAALAAAVVAAGAELTQNAAGEQPALTDNLPSLVKSPAKGPDAPELPSNGSVAVNARKSTLIRVSGKTLGVQVI